ncbi:polysaccharide pyruvyl transferase family protein [Palleronia sp. LCG004]|uniref:polysaccharide pyruvyl transferase family protein n=1 Tax=Palleronia sp. LCG004 TaxID=3079304 RepID=UPI002942D047|nr:polysaccharide pyruvyl transferase family protein [Palleronia sp. LCG004]WOI58408.1 polysaccharide pyruvyl transferase family protein [Palleronia sp. LCG004]
MMGAFGHDYSSLVETLAPLRGKNPVHIFNPGNAGDALIAANTYSFFEAIGLKVEHGYYRRNYHGRHIIFGGGGNLVPHYVEAKSFIGRHRESLKSFVLLPHSVRGHEDFLKTLDDRFTFFVREQKSYDHILATAPNLRLRKCHDMAFFADPRSLRQSPVAGLLRDLRAPRRLRFDLHQFRAWKQALDDRIGQLGTYPPHGAILNAFRHDVESTGGPVPEGNIDISELFMHMRDHGPFMSRQIVDAMVDLVSRYETIRTDRLHVTVLAALMGKDVEMRDNSYGKLGAIHATSIRDFGFDNVRFADP